MNQQLDSFDAPASAPFSFTGFDSLIAPIGRERFFSEYFERKPFLVRRNIANYFDSLFSLEAVDALLGTRMLREPDIRRISSSHKKKGFTEFSRDGVADRNALLRGHAEGDTLVFDQADRLHPPLDRALAQCEAEIRLPFRVNAFLTPPGRKGFNLHYDTHEVIVLQVSGTKNWRICDNPLPLPHEEQQYSHALTDSANVIAELTLHPGDMLYLPRGYIHDASSTDTTSLHISIALRTRALREVALVGLKRELMASAPMRKMAIFDQHATPAAMAGLRSQLHELAERIDLGGALDEVLHAFIMGRSRPVEGRLLELERAQPIDHDTPLRVREDCLFHPFARGESIRLAVDGKTVTLPAAVRPVLDYMRSSGTFCAQNLPGLEYESRLLLAKKLHAAGMLRPAARASV